MVAGHVDVRDVARPLLVEDPLREGEVLGGGLVDEVAVDDQQVRGRLTDLAQGAPRTFDRVGLRRGGDELGIAHHRDPLRALRDAAVAQQRRVVDPRLLRELGRRGRHRAEVRDRDVARVLRLGTGLHDPQALHGQRLRQPLGHSEAHLLPALAVQVLPVQVRHGALPVADLQAGPGAGAVGEDVHRDRERGALDRGRLLGHQVVAARRGGGGEVVGHAHRGRGGAVLPGRPVGRLEGARRPVAVVAEGGEVGEIQDLLHLGAVGERDRRRQARRAEGERAGRGLPGRGDAPAAQTVVGDLEAALDGDLHVLRLEPRPLPVGVVAGEGHGGGVLGVAEVQGAGTGLQADGIAEHAQLLDRLMAVGAVGDGAAARLGAAHDGARRIGVLELHGPVRGEGAVDQERGEVGAEAGRPQAAVQVGEDRVLVLEGGGDLDPAELLGGGVGVEHERIGHLTHRTVRGGVPDRLALGARGAGGQGGGAAAVEVDRVVRPHVREDLPELGQRHPGRGGAAAVEDQHEQLAAVPADAHCGARVGGRDQGVLAHVRHDAVLEDLVAAGDAEVDVLIGADLDVHLVAHLEAREQLRAVLATQQHLAVLGDLRIPGGILHLRDLGDLAVDEGREGDLLGHRVGRADGAVQRVLAPRRGVHPDPVLRQGGVVDPLELVDGAVGRGQLAGGGERLDRGAAAREGQARHGLRGAHPHAVAADRGAQRGVGVVDVEEGAVDRGDGPLAALAGAHHVGQRGAARHRAVIGDVDGQRGLGQVRGEDAALLPAALLEAGEGGEVQARRDAMVLRVAQHSSGGELLVGDLRRGGSGLEGREDGEEEGEGRDESEPAAPVGDGGGRRGHGGHRGSCSRRGRDPTNLCVLGDMRAGSG